MDLTVEDAGAVRDFYAAIIGWEPQEISMGDYADYCMAPPRQQGTDNPPVAGICHRRGANAGLPPVWLVYLMVPDIAASLLEVLERGGKVLSQTRSSSGGHYAIIQDPAGAICALYQEN
ncbi:MAG: VOC family protein [Bryobacteraceae bacterium]|nr:VOC family protein [Bryobacteraceae bacterium]